MKKRFYWIQDRIKYTKGKRNKVIYIEVHATSDISDLSINFCKKGPLGERLDGFGCREISKKEYQEYLRFKNNK
tara:strand:+ start:158 stop:379 length:222 start_codon:yes stop_codon:yes gene_type:complete